MPAPGGELGHRGGHARGVAATLGPCGRRRHGHDTHRPVASPGADP
ncbi:hypothetical protein HBB16_05310 [Pseudonocardia sp. MCCB 268]|nr:hypothetical protein [Pseudonocardia cytotoxica]